MYVLVNPSLEGLVKIGKTNREPSERAKELSAATGVPTPFLVVYEAFFADCTQAEDYVHALVETMGYRVSADREFFSAPAKVAIDAVISAEAHLGTAIPNIPGGDDDGRMTGVSSQPPWQDILSQAYDNYLGQGDDLQDYPEAYRLFKHAARLGSAGACGTLGRMCQYGEGCVQDNQAALEWFQEGSRRGDNDCFAEMALLFMETNHADNARKCWDRYFTSGAPEAQCHYGWCYLMKASHQRQGTVVHANVLREIRDGIIALAEKNLSSAIAEGDYNWRLGAEVDLAYARLFLFPETRSSRKRGVIHRFDSDVTVVPDDNVSVAPQGVFVPKEGFLLGPISPAVGRTVEYDAIIGRSGIMMACNVIVVG